MVSDDSSDGVDEGVDEDEFDGEFDGEQADEEIQFGHRVESVKEGKVEVGDDSYSDGF